MPKAPPHPKNVKVGDTKTKQYYGGGLVLIVHPSGVKTFAFIYRPQGSSKQKMLTLGQYDAESFDLNAARMEALKARAVVKQGRDPAAEKWRALHPNTECLFRTAVEDYIALYAKPKNKSHLETARLLGLRPSKPPINEPWEPEPIKGSPVALWANRNIASVQNLPPAKKRKRYLTLEEIKAFWQGCEL